MAKDNPIQPEKGLQGFDYSAKKAEVIQHAELHGADETVKWLFSTFQTKPLKVQQRSVRHLGN